MIGKTLLISSLAVAAVGASDPAPVIKNNPQGANYLARFDGKQHGIRGNVDLGSAPDGQGVVVNVDFDSLPAQNMGGPFLYHIHEFRVPEDGNCTATGAHLDPQGRGEQPPCDASNPASCQEGDLAGKHGKITTSPAFTAHYTDKYISLIPGTAAFAGNRSIVIHDANTTRIACANFYTASAGYGSGSNSTSANSTSSATSPSGTSNSGSSGSGSSGSGSSGSGSGSSATATPPKPSTTVAASGAAQGVTAAGSAMMLAALAFML